MHCNGIFLTFVMRDDDGDQNAKCDVVLLVVVGFFLCHTQSVAKAREKKRNSVMCLLLCYKLRSQYRVARMCDWGLNKFSIADLLHNKRQSDE